MNTGIIRQPNFIALMLAAGPGKRHKALTNPFYPGARHKGALPVGNLIAAAFQIEAFKRLGAKIIHVGVGVPPLSETLSHEITKEDIYNVKVKAYSEATPLDTAGTLKFLMTENITANDNDVVVILPCDAVHNINLVPILQKHLETQAAVTIVAFPLKWGSSEGEEQGRSFATIKLEGMPEINKYNARATFEEDVIRYAEERKGESVKVTGFYEKRKRNLTESNLIYTSFCIFNVDFLKELFPYITPKDANPAFSDIGLHVLPFVGGNHENFTQCKVYNSDFKEKVLAGRYPVYAYILPPSTYLRDIADPAALLRVNMNVLDGKGDTLLRNSRFWSQRSWGWEGNFGTSIHMSAGLYPPVPGTIGSIVGSHTGIGRTAHVERSVILDGTEVLGKVENSVCCPNFHYPSTSKNIIGGGVTLMDCIYVGGELRFAEALIRNSIIYPTPDGGVAIDPL